MGNVLLGIIALEIYLRYTFNYGIIIRHELVLLDERPKSPPMPIVADPLPDRPSGKSPDLPGPIFFAILKNRLEGGQENMLYFAKGHQYVVVDKLTFIGYEPTVSRSIAMAAFKTAIHSTSVLIFPKGRSYEDTDTRYWTVDKRTAVWGAYEFFMLDGMFSSGTLPRSRLATGNVLSVGLGGSSFNNYIDHMLPNINITAVELEPVFVKISRDWFDLRTSKRHDVVVEDGITFIESAVQRGIHYDIILLDATHSADFYFTVSPVSVFYEDKTLENMATLLGEKGALIVNVLFGRQYNPMKAAKILVDIHLKYFKHVEIRHVPGKRNMVMVARQVPVRRIGIYTQVY